MGVTTYKTKNGNFIIDSKKLNEKVTEEIGRASCRERV